MTEFWETNFRDKQMMWGEEPTRSALFARDYFLKQNTKSILIPGIGYGRNAKPFLDAGMTVTGIEISQTAISLAGSRMELNIPIHHGSVSDMPFDDKRYDGIFSHALIHLLDEHSREKFIQDCCAQLAFGGTMIITAVSTKAPSCGKGTEIGMNRYEQHGGARIFFYDEDAIHREFDQYGLVEIRETVEPNEKNPGADMPFLTAVCRKSQHSVGEPVRCAENIL